VVEITYDGVLIFILALAGFGLLLCTIVDISGREFKNPKTKGLWIIALIVVTIPAATTYWILKGIDARKHS